MATLRFILLPVCMVTTFGLTLLLAGCGTLGTPDAAVHEVIRDQAFLTLPQASNALKAATAEIGDTHKAPSSLDLDLNAALRLATQYSRALQTRREELYLSGLDVLAAVREFEPQCAGTLDYVMAEKKTGSDKSLGGLELSTSVPLPFGGSLAAKGTSLAASSNGLNSANYDTAAAIEVRQPLLAGAGYENSHDALIQANRNLVYSLRSFALDRQDFAIGVIQKYYGLVIQKAVLENTRMNVQQSTYLRQRSEALFKIRRAPSIDVLRSQQQELTARNTLSLNESALQIGLSRFLVEAGLPVDIPLKTGADIPAKKPLSLDQTSCIQLALTQRLDLKTMAEKRDDSQRRLRLARNLLLPELDLYGKAGTRAKDADSPASGEFTPDYVAGVTLELPLDKRAERDAIRRSTFECDAAERAVAEKEDLIRVEISDSFSKLLALSETVEINKRNIEITKKRSDFATYRFKNGDLSNRDVVEAQNDLLSARNAHVRALAQYEQQRLQLLRDVGLLDVDADGTLIELPPPVLENHKATARSN
ncbi:MAG: TolC family protein [bacterium]